MILGLIVILDTWLVILDCQDKETLPRQLAKLKLQPLSELLAESERPLDVSCLELVKSLFSNPMFSCLEFVKSVFSNP